MLTGWFLRSICSKQLAKELPGTRYKFPWGNVIRKRFPDPRVHFALNCASAGCPRLPRQAFSAAHLDQQLDDETRKFLAEERNLRIDHQAQTVFLSAIFDWYRSDFLTWYQQRFPDHAATLLNYVTLYTAPVQTEALQRGSSYAVRFLPYDWSLNDQNRHP